MIHRLYDINTELLYILNYCDELCSNGLALICMERKKRNVLLADKDGTLENK